MSRRIWFVLVIILGIGLGLVFGWLIHPINTSTNPDSLRSDYKIDYVLMVAEIFHKDGNFNAAVQRLNFLGDADSLGVVQQAIIQAKQTGYSAVDLDMMVKLSQVLAAQPIATQGKPG